MCSLQHAKGDVKKKGVPDPYAYIPLDRQKLNRRKKAKLSGQFKHIVGGAVKGSLPVPGNVTRKDDVLELIFYFVM